MTRFIPYRTGPRSSRYTVYWDNAANRRLTPPPRVTEVASALLLSGTTGLAVRMPGTKEMRFAVDDRRGGPVILESIAVLRAEVDALRGALARAEALLAHVAPQETP